MVRWVPALAVVLVPMVAPSGAGAADTLPFTFDPASPVVQPLSSNAFVTASSPGAPACETMDAAITVTVADIVITSTSTQRADGSIDVYFTPYTPGVYTVTAECHGGGEVALITGSVAVPTSDAPGQPTLSATPAHLTQGGAIEVQADHCIFGETSGTVEVWVHGPDGPIHQQAEASSEGTATIHLDSFPVGTYTFQAACIGAGGTVPRFVYPQEPTVEVVAGLGDDPDPSSTTTSPSTTAPSSSTSAPGRSASVTPRFAG